MNTFCNIYLAILSGSTMNFPRIKKKTLKVDVAKMSLISLKKYHKIRIITYLKRNGFQVTVTCFVTACM